MEKMAMSHYDAIICDYQMPEMNGIDLLKMVRAGGNKIPFIMFTGRGREEVLIEALNSGADFYLQKDQVLFRKRSQDVCPHLRGRRCWHRQWNEGEIVHQGLRHGPWPGTFPFKRDPRHNRHHDNGGWATGPGGHVHHDLAGQRCPRAKNELC